MKNTILIVDDHVLFREGLRNIIGHWDDFEVAAEARNGQEAVAKAHELMPDIVLMDISMPVMDGLEATRIIARELPATRVVMLTMSEEGKICSTLSSIGARGYVLRIRRRAGCTRS